MTVYELIYLQTYTGEQMMGLFSIFIGVSSAAIIGAYVAGQQLTRTLAWGIVFLYSITAAALTRVRYGFSEQLQELSLDTSEAVIRDGLTLHSWNPDIGSNFAYSTEAILLAHASIWAAVIFFVFYAKSRLTA